MLIKETHEVAKITISWYYPFMDPLTAVACVAVMAAVLRFACKRAGIGNEPPPPTAEEIRIQNEWENHRSF